MKKTNINDRKRRLISGLGLCLIFATFIAKEIIRDSLKERIGSIESARNVYLSRAETTDAAAPSERLFISAFTDPVTGPGAPDLSEKRIDAIYNLRLPLLLTSTQDFAKGLDNLSRLDREIPDNSASNSDSLKNLIRVFDIVINNVNNLPAEYSKVNSLRGDAKKYGYAASAFDEHSGLLVAKMLDMRIKSHELGTSELEALGLAKEKLEKRYRISIWVSGALFILGWGLNFFGFLRYGIELSEA